VSRAPPSSASTRPPVRRRPSSRPPLPDAGCQRTPPSPARQQAKHGAQPSSDEGRAAAARRTMRRPQIRRPPLLLR
jgi:hypothetical protein